MTKEGVTTDIPGLKSPLTPPPQSIYEGHCKNDNEEGINGQDMKTSESPHKKFQDDDDSKSISGSSDSGNERVREKLKKTSIANVRPESSAASNDQKDGKGEDEDEDEDEDEEKAAASSPAVSESDLDMDDDGREAPRRRTRKRSIEETDPNEDATMGTEPGGNEAASWHRVHERKRSREISEEDMAKAARALNRVKTPPTHPEEDETMGHGEESNPTSLVMTSPWKLERKRSRDRFDDDESDKEADRKKKMVGERKEETEVGADASTSTPSKGLTNGEVFGNPEVSPAERDIKLEAQVSISSGFGNTSVKSPFATASAGSKPLFGGGSKSPDLFKNSSFSAMSGSPSPFASLGSTSRPASPFGAPAGASIKPSGFGTAFGSLYGRSGFGSLVAKSGDVISSAPKLSGPIGAGSVLKPFGAPEEEKSDDEDEDGSGGEPEEKKETFPVGDKKEVFTEQEIVTGEEGEITVFKCPGKIFYFDKENKAWKERGRGIFKLNKTSPGAACAFGLGDSPPAVGKKMSARMIMRTDGTYTVILNVAIYKELKLGGDIAGNAPTGNQIQFSVPALGGGLDLMILKLKSATHAKELHKHVKSLQEELFS